MKDINSKTFTEETKLKLDIFRQCFKEWFPVFVYNEYIKKFTYMIFLQEAELMQKGIMVRH